ncbi:hypothetical protein OS493_036392 [Desmophyllum pertusum]|uniref:Cytochrome b5 heme-binding domain-containing protein n=1 Tax=Desmophyllum pertusum TaxID=174260 RepID=A0A9X0D6U4_9CNID|nr:hypothetical protein OS493_036392 [Desmophyllum pertusum]
MAPNTTHRKGATVVQSDDKSSEETDVQTTITDKELKEHNGANGSPSWIAIKDKVYDVSNFGKEHPGGNIIFTHAGQTATDVFSAFHPAAVYNWLPRFYVGELVKDSSSTPSDAEKEVSDYRRDITAMKSELMKARAFESSKLYYAFKVTSNAAILSAAVAAIVVLNGMPGAVIGGFLLALFWQQCGWLAHDFLHHQVFTNRMYNNLGRAWDRQHMARLLYLVVEDEAQPPPRLTQRGTHRSWRGPRHVDNAFAVVVREDHRRRLRRSEGPSQVHGQVSEVLLPSTDGCCADIVAVAIPPVSARARAQVRGWFTYEDRRDCHAGCPLRCCHLHYVAARNSCFSGRLSAHFSIIRWSFHCSSVHCWS